MRRLAGLVVAAVIVALAGLVATGAVPGWPAAQAGPAGASPAVAASPAGSVAARPTPSSAPAGGPIASPSPSPSPAGAAPGPETRRVSDAALEAALTAWVRRTGTPGASAAVLWPDGRLWLGVAGVADAATKRPMTTDTAFAYASVTKTFTAAIIEQLIDEGRLGIDQAVAPLLPGEGLDPRITVRNLLDHTSGLPDFFRVTGIEPALNKNHRTVWTVEDSLAFGRKDRAAPDTFWRYSNTGYVYLGMIAEAVTGESWAELVRTRLLDPLGLHETFIQGVETPPVPLSQGHRVTGTGAASKATPLAGPGDPMVPFTSVVTASGSAGEIAGTAEDAARWAADLYGGTIVSPAMIRAAIADVNRVDRFHPKIRYGLGVQLVKYGSHVTWGHSGTFIGFKEQIRWLPDLRIAVVLLTNQSRYETTAIERRLIDLAASRAGPTTCEACR